MQLPELLKSIKIRDKKPLYLFTGEEIAVMDIYIKQIVKAFGMQAVRVDTVGEIFNKIKNKSLLNQSTCYIISNDQEFLKAEKIWQELEDGKVQGQNVIILTYPTLDKRGKFYKHFNKEESCHVEFEKMAPEVLAKYITQRLDLSSVACNKLINICDANYNRILLELDKVKHLANAMNISPDAAFNEALKSKLFYIPTGDIIFEFIDAVCLRSKSKSFSLWQQLKSFESPVKVISLLYSSFRNILVVQAAKGVDKICDFTGLTPWQVKLAKDKQGKFSESELIKIVKLVRGTEKGIKRGEIEAEIAVDYLLVNILGA